MVTRSRRRRDGLLSFFRRKRKPNFNSQNLLCESDFSLAVEKERCRSERRELSFCIILFDFEEQAEAASLEKFSLLANSFRRRLRITDEIGMYRNTLAVLLPETISAQAATVINDLTVIALEQEIAVLTEIFAYPESDFDQRPPNKSGNDGVFEVEVNGDESFDEPREHSRKAESGPSAVVARVATATKPVISVNEKATSMVRVHRLKTLISTPWWKRAIDITGASVGLIVLSPVFLAATIMVRLNSKGPAFFTQWREGKDGQLFEIYKFRTMRVGADDEKSAFRKMSEQDGPAFKLKNDPRLTSVGSYLRKSCVDELPQLINVLKGEMSLVGPRPLPVDESLNCSVWHRRRLDVLPGMTCIWQVDGGRDIAFDEWMRMDLEYVRNRGLITDLKLIIKTAFVTLLHRGSV